VKYEEMPLIFTKYYSKFMEMKKVVHRLLYGLGDIKTKGKMSQMTKDLAF
jgi:hypothetical protein